MGTRTCSNCGKKAALTQMIAVKAGNKTIANICLDCQKAKKIQVTLLKDKEGNWTFYQYFPVET